MRCRARLPSCASASHARATGTASLRWGRCRCNDRTIRRARGSHAAVAEQERKPCGEDGEASGEPNTPSASTSHLFSCILMKNKAIVNITPCSPDPSCSLSLFVYLHCPPFPARWLASCHVVVERLLLRLLACLCVVFIGITPARQ